MSGSRAIRNQLDLINIFVQYWDSSNPDDNPEYGTITGEGLGHVMDDSRINMDYVVKAAGSWDSSFIESKLAISPVLIGYNELEVNGFHVNIIHSLNRNLPDVNVMDPNGGRYRTRSHTHFNTANYVLG